MWDRNIRRVLEVFAKNLNENVVVKADFKTVEANITVADSYKIRHGEKFIPNAILIVSQSGTGVPTINYDKTDETHIVIDTTGPVKLRLLYGRL